MLPNSREPHSGPSHAEEHPHKPSPMSLAVEWVARITGVALVMVLPGFVGSWLDSWIGVNFLALAGFAIGFIAGFVALLAMVKQRDPIEVRNHE